MYTEGYHNYTIYLDNQKQEDQADTQPATIPAHEQGWEQTPSWCSIVI